jgi:hypothetical protein
VSRYQPTVCCLASVLLVNCESKAVLLPRTVSNQELTDNLANGVGTSISHDKIVEQKIKSKQHASLLLAASRKSNALRGRTPSRRQVHCECIRLGMKATSKCKISEMEIEREFTQQHSVGACTATLIATTGIMLLARSGDEQQLAIFIHTTIHQSTGKTIPRSVNLH